MFSTFFIQQNLSPEFQLTWQYRSKHTRMTTANECGRLPIGECSLRRWRHGINNNIYIHTSKAIHLSPLSQSFPESFLVLPRGSYDPTPRSGPFFFLAYPSFHLSFCLSSPLASPVLFALLSSWWCSLPLSLSGSPWLQRYVFSLSNF